MPTDSEFSTPGAPLAGGGGGIASEPGGRTITLGDTKLRVLELRQGGMGEVLIAEYAGQPTPQVAIKTFQKKYFFDPAIRDAFLREVVIWARLSGVPFIMPVMGIYLLESRPCVLMVAVTREPHTLRVLLNRGPIEPAAALYVALQVSVALERASAVVPDLVHGDLKPENCLLIVETGRILISDFGLARATEDFPNTPLESTWAYRAPELWSGGAAASVASDVYAFGAVLAEMLGLLKQNRKSSREEWQESHRSGLPVQECDSSASSLTVSLRALAVRCLNVDPTARPADFGSVSATLRAVSEAHDLRIAQEALAFADHYTKSAHANIEMLLRPVTAGLLEVGAHAAALKVVESVPAEQLPPTLLSLKGSALSLNGRDEEALACFQGAIPALEGTDLTRCLNEMALSLKRLKRFDKAEAIYDRLVTGTTDKARNAAVINLAQLYAETGRLREGAELLQRYAVRNPDIPMLWGALGEIRVRLGECDAAAEAMRRALQLAPHLTQIQMDLARVCLQLRCVEEAESLLDAVFRQGRASAEWVVLTLATKMLLDRKDDAAQLLQKIGAELPKEMADQIVQRVLAIVRDVVSDKNLCMPQEQEARSDASRDPSAPKPPPADADDASRPAGPFMFLNLRQYNPEESYSIDFYYPWNKPDYAAELAASWQRLFDNPKLHLSTAMFLPQPLYFTKCPGCELRILTNRRPGKKLNCRNCDFSAPTQPIEEDEEMTAIIRECEKAIGRTRRDFDQYVQMMAVTHAKLDELSRAEKILEKRGFSRLPEHDPLTVLLLLQIRRQGVTARPSFWRKMCNGPSPGYVQDTSPELYAAIAEFRQSIEGLYTSTTSLPPDALLLKDRTEMLRALEAHLKTDDLEGIAEKGEILTGLGDLAQAQVLLNRALVLDPGARTTRMFEGRLARAQGSLEKARDCFRQCVDADPLDRDALLNLVYVHEQLGDEGGAAAARAQLQALGGFAIDVPW